MAKITLFVPSMVISRRIKITYTITTLLALIGYICRLIFMEEIGPAGNFKLFLLSLIGIPFLWEMFRGLNAFMEKHLPLDTYQWERILTQLFLSEIVMFSLRTVGAYVMKDYFPFRFEEMFTPTLIAIDVFFIASINMGYFAAAYFKRWRTTIQKAERLEREKSQVQFDNLKNQLNPHFLFNALTSLNSLIFENQELASQFLKQLSKVYRYLLQHKDKRSVSVYTELNFIENYIFLLQTRFGSALKVVLQIREEDRDKGIVPVSLQAMLENALKHNVIHEQRPLYIEIVSDGEYVQVKNNLQRKTIVENSNKHGLENLRSLYRYLSPKEFVVSEENGFFIVKIPLL